MYEVYRNVIYTLFYISKIRNDQNYELYLVTRLSTVATMICGMNE